MVKMMKRKMAVRETAKQVKIFLELVLEQVKKVGHREVHKPKEAKE